MHFLELNDWRLRAWDPAGTLLCEQTAAASCANGELCFGDAALAHSRSHPQQFNHRYLGSLSADPLPAPLGSARNHADLTYHNLRQLALPATPVGVCVSGSLSNQQLGLFLGICQEVGLQVCGFLDTALVHSLAVPAHADFHVLEIEMHRTTLSHVAVTPGQRNRVHTATFDGTGVAAIVDGWMNVIADQFVQKTRFDPLHTGQTEQTLFDQVRGWLRDVSISDQHVRVSQATAVREIEVSAQLLREKFAQRLGSIELDHVEHLILGPQAAKLPGLRTWVAERVKRVDSCNDADLAANCRQLAEAFVAGDIRRVTSAAVATSVDEPSALPPQPLEPPPQATHLLHEFCAYALSDPRFGGADVGEPIVGTQLRIDDALYTAIRIE